MNLFETMRRMLQTFAIGGVLIAIAIMFAAAVHGSFATNVALLPPTAAAETLLQSMPAGFGYETVTVQARSSDNVALALPMAAVNASLYLLVAGIMWLLSQVFAQAERGRPFVPVHVGRMRRVAWLTTAAALVAFYAQPFASSWTASRIGAGSWSVQVSFVPLFIAAAAFALAAIWRLGAELADLEEHTV